MSIEPSGRRRFNRLSIVSFCLAFVPLLGLAHLVALVLGLVAHRQITNSHGIQRGYGFALGAIVLGACGVAVAIGLFLTPTFLAIEEKRGADVLGDGTFSFRARYNLWGGLRRLGIARNATSVTPMGIYGTWRGNLLLIDARSGKSLVLNVPPKPLQELWREVQQNVREPIPDKLLRFSRSLGDPEAERLIGEMVSDPSP